MLSVDELEVHYGQVEAVRGISIEVHPGRITLVLGANGAGKSSTLKAIAGLETPVGGGVTLDETDITGWPPHEIVRKGLALVPEGRRVFAPLSVAENLRLGGFTAPKAEFNETLERAYEMFPILYTRRNGAAGLLSGGEQQMLAFGRAMMSQPEIMLLDEPSMGLAPVVVDLILEKVREMADAGIGILMVEQNAEAGLDLADQVVAIARGEIVYSGSAVEAREDSSILRAYLGDAALA